MDFTKIQAAGNDFVVIDARDREDNWGELSRAMCHRHFGVGADGLILVCKSESADFRMRIFNADGTEAEACGNGLRCFTKYVIDKGLAAGNLLTAQTMAGTRKLEAFQENGSVKKVKAGMGKPALEANEIPVSENMPSSGESEIEIMPIIEQVIPVGKKVVKVSLVSMGNPHAVTITGENVEDYDLHTIGPVIEHHPMFPRRTNFEVAHIISRNTVKARVWERGVGETLACGSGACAIAVVTTLRGLTDEKVDIMLPGGTLTVEWDRAGEVYLTGPVERVFEGIWP